MQPFQDPAPRAAPLCHTPTEGSPSSATCTGGSYSALLSWVGNVRAGAARGGGSGGRVYVGLAPEKPHVRTVTDVMAESMVNWGIRHVWGMVGHSNLGLADALRRQEAAGHLAYYGVRHEGAAAFAASAYGKLTGRPAACFSIAGPGATNLLTGLWDANVGRSPVLALTGQVDTQVLGPGAFQEIDLQAAFGKVARSMARLSSSRTPSAP